MLELRKVNKKKIDLVEALNYIKENTPDKIKNEKIADVKDELGNHLKRTYTIEDKEGIINIFILENEDKNVYLTHKFNNPNTELELDDEEIF